MPVMVPLTSDLKETPSSTALLGPLSTVAGTVELDQMVCCWASALALQPQATAQTNSAAPASFGNSTRDVFVAARLAIGFMEPARVPRSKRENVLIVKGKS